MSDPDRRPVRVRRAPKVSVFLGAGLLLGIVAAVIIALATPADGQYPTSQVLGFLVLLLAPIGAVVGGVVAVVRGADHAFRVRKADARTAEGVAAEVGELVGHWLTVLLADR